MTGGQWGLLLLLSVLWGGSFFFVEVGLAAFPLLTLVVLRVGLAALALHLVLRLQGRPPPAHRRALAAYLGMGLLNNALPFSLIVWGQTQITGGLASILNATTPLFGVLVAHRLTRDERLRPHRLAGVAAGFLGVVLVVGPEALGGLDAHLLGELAVLAASLCYAFASLFGRRFHRLGIAPAAAAAGQVSASALLLAPLALVLERPWTLPAPPATAWAAVAGLALLSTALAFILYFRILASAGATNILLVTFLIPVTAILLGAAFLGEALAPHQLAGMAVIAAGLAVMDGRLLARLRAAAAGGA
ncbi:threonine/homoserine efflux transporter RhtA [Inmirania thermothiophila]|uniref:Threonine/homoserine efflux transporter RhtA n=2 Tax=Inmirania thermothiophila TaxID=1750597 RepID=A0A3N1Y029_9GAMM|nr:threonine/homoserine efflux transporter RhtA [Inmirania thermothiophila]